MVSGLRVFRDLGIEVQVLGIGVQGMRASGLEFRVLQWASDVGPYLFPKP